MTTQAQHKALFVCPSKDLQHQFSRDFDAPVLKGKSNYPTANFPHLFFEETPWYEEHTSCEDCDFKRTTGCCSYCTPFDEASGPEKPLALFRCPYNIAKRMVESAAIGCMNNALYLATMNYSRWRGKHRFMIFDEGDELEGTLMGTLEVHIPAKRMEQLGIGPPKLKTVARSWHEWVVSEATPAVKNLLKDMLCSISRPCDDPDHPCEDCLGLGCGEDRRYLYRDFNKKERREFRLWTQCLERLGDLAEEIPEGNWVYMGDAPAVTFRPVRIGNYAEKMLFKHGDRHLIMSASLISPSAMADDLGIQAADFEAVIVPSTFPRGRRPVYVVPVAENSYNNRNQAWPAITGKIIEILQRHGTERVLIHTVSYAFNDYVAKWIQERLNFKPLTYRSANERKRVIDQYVKTPCSVLLGPSLERGLDLKGDLCRVQIICKVPYLNYKTDPQVKARYYSRNGRTWYQVQTVRELVQMTGRAMRSADDWCVTYILDAAFCRLWNEWGHLFPSWWREAVLFTDFCGVQTSIQTGVQTN